METFVCLFDIFSGWVEAYPTRTEKSSEVMKSLLKEIIPCFGLFGSIQRGNGLAFISEITWMVSKFLRSSEASPWHGDLRFLGRSRRGITH